MTSSQQRFFLLWAFLLTVACLGQSQADTTKFIGYCTVKEQRSQDTVPYISQISTGAIYESYDLCMNLEFAYCSSKAIGKHINLRSHMDPYYDYDRDAFSVQVVCYPLPSPRIPDPTGKWQPVPNWNPLAPALNFEDVSEPQRQPNSQPRWQPPLPQMPITFPNYGDLNRVLVSDMAKKLSQRFENIQQSLDDVWRELHSSGSQWQTNLFLSALVVLAAGIVLILSGVGLPAGLLKVSAALATIAVIAQMLNVEVGNSLQAIPDGPRASVEGSSQEAESLPLCRILVSTIDEQSGLNEQRIIDGHELFALEESLNHSEDELRQAGGKHQAQLGLMCLSQGDSSSNM